MLGTPQEIADFLRDVDQQDQTEARPCSCHITSRNERIWDRKCQRHTRP